ncbi:MAG: aldehyde ferredoxin oxidoreductase N-terminal domain-containing protein [Dehalococcoidales bacterium]
MPDFGYAGQILKVDLSNEKVSKQPSAEYTGKYIGGHGLAARLYWEMVPPQAKAADPENCFVCASGPLTGFPGFAGFRWKICAKTSLNVPESFNYCNLGDKWGAILKYAGYDALAVQGKADKPVYIYLHNAEVEIKDASHLRCQSTFDTSDALKAELGKGVSILTIGPAAEARIPFSTVLAEGGASGSGGMGAVMGSKNLKAIVVAGNKRPVAAHPDKVKELVGIIQANLRKSSMLPMAIPGLTRLHNCFGCGIGCYREIYTKESRDYKVLCQASMMYGMHSMKYTGKNDGAHLLATRLCDGYGLDTSVMQSMIEWLEICYNEGILDEKKTGLPLSKIGSSEFISELTRIITLKEGFGATLAKGIIPAADDIGPKAKALMPMVVATRGSEKKDYDPRILITTALAYATEPRRPIQQLHEVSMLAMMWVGMGPPGADIKPGSMFSTENLRRYAEKNWGSAAAADFSTYDGKALAAKNIQDNVFAKESLVTCDLRWTMAQVNYTLGLNGDTVSPARVYSAITGKETDETELSRLGEKVFNLQRAILLRQGWQGRKDDTLLDYFFTTPVQKGELFFNANGLMPGKNGEVISRVGCVVEKDKFEKMKTEYYGYRGWDAATGLPKQSKLNELGLQDIAADLAGRGLAK